MQTPNEILEACDHLAHPDHERCCKCVRHPCHACVKLAIDAAVGMTELMPVMMLLWCPECGARHVDVGEFETKVHHTHACQHCGHVWRPAIGPTVGVQFLPGFKNPSTYAEADRVLTAAGFPEAKFEPRAGGEPVAACSLCGEELDFVDDTATHRPTGKRAHTACLEKARGERAG